jgi:hypothetical protein
MRKSISVVAAAAATTAATVMIGSTPAVVALEEQVSRYTPAAADMICIVNSREEREREG